MKHFAMFLPMKDEEKSNLYREDHLAYLDKKREEGRIFANGRFTDGWGGLIIYLADSKTEVEEIAKNDPYIMTGARDYEIHEWDVVTEATFPYKHK